MEMIQVQQILVMGKHLLNVLMGSVILDLMQTEQIIAVEVSRVLLLQNTIHAIQWMAVREKIVVAQKIIIRTTARILVINAMQMLIQGYNGI